MGLLRRLFGGADRPADEPSDDADPGPAAEQPPDEDERSREVELLRAEQARLDPLSERQLRYADRAWRPPRQGGERRADDSDDASG